MTATNHALTGAAIGLAVGNPWIALPTALASHFVCDMIPHFGMGDSFITTKTFRNFLIVDALLCLALVILLGLLQPLHWAVAVACALIATSPDFLWIPLYRASLRREKFIRTGFYKFAANIQWFERPIGGVVEVVWFFAVGYMVGSLMLV